MAARAQSVTVRGTVITADAAPVVGVAVVLESANHARRQVTTGDDGSFAFSGTPYGPAMLRVRRIGFRPDSAALTVDADAMRPVAIILTAAPQSLAPVVVRAPHAMGPLAAFYRRRSTGQGHYISRADIEHRHPAYTSDLFRMVPGLSLVRSAGQLLLRFRGSACAPEVFIDGTPLGPMAMDFDAIGPNTIEGIEIYSGTSTVPLEFHRAFGRTSCGTVLLWTREGEPRAKKAKGEPVTTAQIAALLDGAEVFTAEQVESAAKLTGDFSSEIRVPVALNDFQSPATVVAEFVVDTDGKVEPLTINVVAASGPGFADAVRSALPSAHFTPALRAGHAVRQFTQLNVVLDPARNR